MKTSSIQVLGAALMLLAAQAWVGAAHAQEQGALKISNAVFQEVQVKAADGTVAKKLVPAERAVPGGEVVYEVDFENTGKAAATNVAITNPVPAELTYIDTVGTAATDVSIDGGKQFGKLTELTVTDSDGTTRAAQPADVTHLRWVIATLKPGAKGKVSFKARVK